MRNLLNFLIKYNYWFLFVMLEVASFILLFRFNNYQGSTFFTSTNAAAGKIYELRSSVTSYFYLKSANEELLDRNMMLEQQIAGLKKELRERGEDSLKVDSMFSTPLKGINLLKADVIDNSLTKAENFVTLDKGSSDGIRRDMGVIDRNGVVGVVCMTSPHYSLVIPLISSKSNVNCKLLRSGYFGPLKWEGGDSRYAFLNDLPRHAKFSLGDTVVTSGYSEIFPQGIMVGTVDHIGNSKDGLSYQLKIRLATDFGKLSNVRVIPVKFNKEQMFLKQMENKQ
ncbi:rod shape-determining protein MreC [Bacteroides sedimenti]|uniref:Cell shape-determining protein MreC n=1 Tax=Bacteroides sedimenti TaxID=2136147 RepID=A0ABM8IFB2_9BACE